MGYSRLLRKVAERVLRDITIIIFRRFSESSSLHLLREQHMHNHKITGMQVKRQRSMRITSGVKGEEESESVKLAVKQGVVNESTVKQGVVSESTVKQGAAKQSTTKQDTSNQPPTTHNNIETPLTTTPSPSQPSAQPGWDAAALRIITFLSSRINPNVFPRRR